MILESLGIEYREKNKHVYIVVLGKHEDDEYVTVLGVSAANEEDCIRQCGGQDNILQIMPLDFMLQNLEIRDFTDGYVLPSYGGRNDTRPH